MSRRLARSPIGTGPSPERPSSARARSAYGLFVVIEITRPMLRPTASPPQREPTRRRRSGRPPPGEARLQPAALGGDEDGMGAVDRAELAVDFVQVGADRARRQRQL